MQNLDLQNLVSRNPKNGSENLDFGATVDLGFGVTVDLGFGVTRP